MVVVRTHRQVVVHMHVLQLVKVHKKNNLFRREIHFVHILAHDIAHTLYYIHVSHTVCRKN